jgi:hypothetical protein
MMVMIPTPLIAIREVISLNSRTNGVERSTSAVSTFPITISTPRGLSPDKSLKKDYSTKRSRRRELLDAIILLKGGQ